MKAFIERLKRIVLAFFRRRFPVVERTVTLEDLSVTVVDTDAPAETPDAPADDGSPNAVVLNINERHQK